MLCSNCRKQVTPVDGENPHIVDPNARHIAFFCDYAPAARCPMCDGIVGNCNIACAEPLSEAKRKVHERADQLIQMEIECRELYLAGKDEEYRNAYTLREAIASDLRGFAWDAAAITIQYQMMSLKS